MENTKERQEWLDQSTGRAVDVMTRWAEANQKALGEIVTLTAAAATEGVRLYGAFQASALESAKAGRAYWLRRLADLDDLQTPAV
ncbi:MAG: hypothetical protein ACT4PY_09750 [Armatimonadota bacterium]